MLPEASLILKPERVGFGNSPLDKSSPILEAYP